MTDTQKILAEFESLYEDQKEILDRPVCCTRKDCLCSKVIVWEHLKSFITTSIQQADQEMIKRVEKYNDEQISTSIWGDEYRDGFDHAFGGIWEILSSLDKPVTDKD